MEWKEYKLGDVCDLIAGYAFKSKDFGDYHTKAIRIGDIVPPQIDYANSIGVNLSNYNIEKLEKYIVKNGDYLLAMTGATIGKVGRYRYEDSSYINQRVLKFSPKIKIDKDFLYYVVSSPNFAKYINNHIDSESAQPNISANTLGKYCFNAPSIQSQRRIASILSSLDDKIAVNRKICENLETQAQALFKNWFVDFEPFKNGEFVESELGMIPKGWKVGTLGEISQKIGAGGTPKSSNRDYYDGNIAWFGTGEFNDSFLCDSEKHINQSAIDNSSAKLFPKHTVIIAMYGATVGRLAILTKEAAFNQAALGLVAKENINYPFIYLTLLFIRKRLVLLACGAAQQNLNANTIKNFKIVIPNDTTLKEFNEILLTIFGSIENKTKESSRLAALRDTLLPKLMSGEIEVGESM